MLCILLCRKLYWFATRTGKTEIKILNLDGNAFPLQKKQLKNDYDNRNSENAKIFQEGAWRILWYRAHWPFWKHCSRTAEREK
jgi:hypothetical protein